MPAPPKLLAPDQQRVDQVLGRYRERVVAEMQAALDYPGVEHLRYMRYHLGWEDADGNAVAPAGGKMLRPALCLLCCEAVGGDIQAALPAAAALELLHNFTLIHDDIEDSSDKRHGKPSLWRVAGVAQAINAGDGMFVLAQRTLLRLSDRGVPPGRVLDAARILDDASVALCEGQHADLEFERRARVSQADYEAMVAGKTSALLGASAAIGGIVGGADRRTVDALATCGIRLGLAFQIRDDVLGVWGDADVTGKPVADDIRARKKSFPLVYASGHLDDDAARRLDAILATPDMTDDSVSEVLTLLDATGARAASDEAAHAWAGSALEAIAPLELEPERHADIEALAAFLVQRTS